MSKKLHRAFPPEVDSDFWTLHPSDYEWTIRRWRVTAHEPNFPTTRFNAREVRSHDGAPVEPGEVLESVYSPMGEGWGGETSFIFAGRGVGITTLAVFPSWDAANASRRTQIADRIASHEESANRLRTWNP